MSSSSWQESARWVRCSAGHRVLSVKAKVPGPKISSEWKKSLLGPAPVRVYDSGTHTDARMHLGGIGTGNFEIGADGQFTTWQLFNTLRDGEVPFYFLARAGKATRLLQTRGGPDWPRIKQIAMTGEYPLATLRFSDPDLPVQVEMAAFSPFAPLDTKLSSIPTAVFVFRIHNPTARAEEVSLAALLMNPVGYDAAVRIEGQEHPNFGGNVNEVFHDARHDRFGAEGRDRQTSPPSMGGCRSRPSRTSRAWSRRRMTGRRGCVSRCSNSCRDPSSSSMTPRTP